MKKQAKLIIAAALALVSAVLPAQDRKVLAENLKNISLNYGKSVTVYIQQNLPTRFDMEIPDGTDDRAEVLILSAKPDAEQRLENFYRKESGKSNRFIGKKDGVVTVSEKDGDVKTAAVLAPDLFLLTEDSPREIHPDMVMRKPEVDVSRPGLALYYYVVFNNNAVSGLTVVVDRLAPGQYQLTAKFAASDMNVALPVIRSIMDDELDDEPALRKKLNVTPNMTINAVLNGKELDEAWDVLGDFNPSDD